LSSFILLNKGNSSPWLKRGAFLPRTSVIIHGTVELAKFTAQLVKEEVDFNVKPQLNDVGVVSYTVTFTGGY